MRLRFFGFCFMPVLIMGQARIQQVTTVCSVLDALPTYRNQIVTIRGKLLRNEEGSYLAATECKRPLVIMGYTWSPEYAIYLTPPDSPFVENREDSHVEVKVDPTSDRLLSRYSNDTRVQIWVTVTGRLETRLKFDVVRWGDGRLLPYGYGHLNASPAQLVIREMKDVKVRFGPPRK